MVSREEPTQRSVGERILRCGHVGLGGEIGVLRSIANRQRGPVLTLDLSNPVVAAVGRGTQSEMAGDREGARAAYTEAWDSAKDDLERCIAAHFVPRTIDDPREKLRWNEDALRYAVAVGDERVTGFFASLHASVGQARLGVGDTPGAQDALRQAEATLDSVPAGPYKDGLVASIDALKQACLAPMD